jgi:16S rRNA processing protein RimM
MDELVEIGRIVKPHGLAGDVVVELTTDRDERLAVGSRLEADRAGERETLTVGRSSCQRPATERRHARWIVHFDGIDDLATADAWRDATLSADPLDDPDELWVHELIGAEVVLAADGTSVGSCVAVLANPAADLLELDGGALVPVVFVVGTAEGQVVIDPPPGLLEL